MVTKVESFLREPNADQLIDQLSTYLGAPGRETIVRAAALLLCPSSRSGKHWRSLAVELQNLFLRSAYSPSEDDVGRYILGKNYPRVEGQRIRARVALWCAHTMELNSVLTETPFFADINRMGDTLDRVLAFVTTKKVDSLMPTRGVQLFDTINRIFSAFQAMPDNGKISTTFFGALETSADELLSDTSYYVIYRYSTGRERIVKTFVALKTPADGANCFSFTHVYNAGIRRQKRVIRGPVLSYDNCVYFAGLAAPALTPAKTQGVELIALPDVGGRTNPDHLLLTGLCLSHGTGWQPVAARLVMIHLGFRSEVGHEVDDAEVQVKPLAVRRDLRSDLKALDEKFRLCDRSGLELDAIEAYIFDHISNIENSDRPPGYEGVFRALTVEDGRSALA